MEGDLEGDFENSVGERDFRYVTRFHARGGGLKFLGWICLVCLLLKALKKHLLSRCFYSKINRFPVLCTLIFFLSTGEKFL